MSAASMHTTVTGPNVWERRLLLGATMLVVTAVAGIAGAISYGHMHDWASANGEPAWRALLFPLSVDGLLIAASAVLLADSRAGRRADWLAYVLVIVGSSVSVTANVAHDWVSRVAEVAIAGWPPLALVGSYELLMRLLRRLQLPAESTEAAPIATEDRSKAEPAQVPTAPRTAKTSQAKRATITKPRTAARKSRPSREPEARVWWDRERAEGREPSGAQVARAVGVDDSLGRRWLREWQATDTTTNPAVSAAPGTTGESRTGTDTDATETIGRAA